MVVGYSPDDRGDDALALAALIRSADRSSARAADGRQRPSAPWPARSPASVDAEWVAYLRGQAEEALAGAAARLGELQVPRSELDLRVRAHRGSGRGLIEAAREVGADLVVIGSAPGGRRGRIAIGSTADQLLHDSPVPVMLAPRGYAEESLHHHRMLGPDRSARRLERMTVAFWPRRDVEGPLLAAAALAQTLGLPMRLLTLVVRPAALAARLGGVAARWNARSPRPTRTCGKPRACSGRAWGTGCRWSGSRRSGPGSRGPWTPSICCRARSSPACPAVTGRCARCSSGRGPARSSGPRRARCWCCRAGPVRGRASPRRRGRPA
ncbi:universal stress protein [Actinomadura luteofluorescens]|uniref:universal stress protein n=1 Tax=Actinomadura luteofluorescens TaxID=46163 RepID=UPI00363BCCB5